jgi:CheY-like chemotaxis protein
MPFARRGFTERHMDGAELYFAYLRGVTLIWWEGGSADRLYAAASEGDEDALVEFALLCIREGQPRPSITRTPSSRALRRIGSPRPTLRKHFYHRSAVIPATGPYPTRAPSDHLADTKIMSLLRHLTKISGLASRSHCNGSMKTLSQEPPILLVDDNDVVRDMLVDLVGSLGYRADAAASGAEALTLFDRGRYGIVLTDLLMPGLSGWDVLAALRQRDPHIPVIIVTGSPVGADPRAFQPGVAVLKKPVDVTALDAMIKHMLHARLAV